MNFQLPTPTTKAPTPNTVPNRIRRLCFVVVSCLRMATLSPWGVPPGGVADGLDALLAIVQMPKGVPVATVGVGNGENAGLLAAAILAVSDPALRGRLEARRATQAEAIAADEANAGL